MCFERTKYRRDRFFIMTDKRDVRRLPALVTSIKIEPGTLGAAPGRLPSFGGRRDLTLGASGVPNKLNQNSESKPRKIYTPNLNVQRNKNKVDVNAKDGHLNAKEKRDRHKKDDFRGKKRDKANNLIQSSGVFSEGVAGKSKRYSGHGGGGGRGGDRDSSNNFIPMPKLNLQHERKIDKEEEELKLKELLRDNFLDDPGMEPDTRNAPVMLPMLSMAKIKSEIKTEIKTEPKELKQIEVGGVKIKQEKLDDDKEAKVENGLTTEMETTKMKLPDDIMVAELLESKDPQLIFVQLPDCLPGLKPESDAGPARPTATAKASTAVSDSTSAGDSAQNESPPQQCTLNTLTEGCIGKLQLLKSGNARLVLGNIVLHLDMGTQLGFRQDLISVDLDHTSRGGDMINLGAIKTRMVCTPDWEAMLSKPVTS